MALVLPLSGAFSAVGQKMLLAARLALDRIKYSYPLKINVFDNKGTKDGTIIAANKINKLAPHLILGPVVSQILIF